MHYQYNRTSTTVAMKRGGEQTMSDCEVCIKLIEAQKQLIQVYEEKITVLEEQNDLLEKAIRSLVRIAKGADDEEVDVL